MSYSFTIKAPSRAVAKQQVVEEMAKVVASQPDHAQDQNAAISAANAFIDQVGEPTPEQEVYVHVAGSLSWTTLPEPEVGKRYTGASIHINIGLNRPT